MKRRKVIQGVATFKEQRGTVVKDLRLDAIGFELEANLFVEIAKKGYRIAELPIHYRRRSTPPSSGP